MKVVLQRVSRGSVRVDGETVGHVGRGYVAVVGIRRGDTERDARRLAEKTVLLRVFPDETDRMNRNIQEVGGALLAISQFTLYADTRHGNRPGFSEAAPPEIARPLFETYVEALRRMLGPERVATGFFGARMTVEIVNEGPVTIELSTDDRDAGASAKGKS